MNIYLKTNLLYIYLFFMKNENIKYLRENTGSNLISRNTLDKSS